MPRCCLLQEHELNSHGGHSQLQLDTPGTRYRRTLDLVTLYTPLKNTSKHICLDSLSLKPPAPVYPLQDFKALYKYSIIIIIIIIVIIIIISLFGRLLQVTVHRMLWDHCLSVCLSDCLSVMLVYCGQAVGWIKMPLGTVVGLSSGNIVLDGDPAPLRKGAQQPTLFGSCLLWPNGRPSRQLLSSC